MDNLKLQELKCELEVRGIITVGKRKPQLERDFDDLRRGIVNVPALLQGVPDKKLKDFGLENYKISPVEPLHDLKVPLSNIIDEIRVSVSSDMKKKVESICARVLNKETLRGSDYRKGAVLPLSALHELHPASTLTTLLQTAVEICEIL